MNKFFTNSKLRLRWIVSWDNLKCYFGFHNFHAHILSYSGKMYYNEACTWCNKTRKDINNYE